MMKKKMKLDDKQKFGNVSKFAVSWERFSVHLGPFPLSIALPFSRLRILVCKFGHDKQGLNWHINSKCKKQSSKGEEL